MTDFIMSNGFIFLVMIIILGLGVICFIALPFPFNIIVGLGIMFPIMTAPKDMMRLQELQSFQKVEH